MNARTRIAPSPTGAPHVGTAYIALFNYCFARQNQGQFILRIEDTDRKRSKPNYQQQLLSALKWLGLQWDEGPDVGGPFGPYQQSQRLAIYQKYTQQLLEQGDAFYCFRTPEELNQIREQRRAQGLIPGFKLEHPELPEVEIKQRLAAKEPYVIRLKVPMEGVCEIHDGLRGKIEVNWSQVDMQILLKSDGMPTYHLANVVDDHLMQISHVIRGEEWISSTPKHLLLYQYFGWESPHFFHMPLLRNPDKSKLSKRKNPTSIMFYERMGYLPEALINYLGRMGWSMPNEAEKFTLAEMLANFDLKRVTTTGPVFDLAKLNWLNGKWIRENLTQDAFIQRLQSWALNTSYLSPLVPHLKQRIENFTEILPLASFSLLGALPIQQEQFEHKHLSLLEVRKILQFSLWQLTTLDQWQRSNIETELTSLAKLMQLPLKHFFTPLFIAITGTHQSIDLLSAMSIIGSELTLFRIQQAISLLGKASKKELKNWEKEYRTLSAVEIN